MSRPELIPAIALAAVLVMMVGELILSRANERILRRHGAVEPQGDVYRVLAVTYPGMFVAIAIEGFWSGRPFGVVAWTGGLVFLLAKLLKMWAIYTLGPRWTYRVLVPPEGRLITHGPYAWLRHPNYVAVFGEIAGMALLVGAPVSGVLSLLTFAILVKARIAVEERALGRSQKISGVDRVPGREG